MITLFKIFELKIETEESINELIKKQEILYAKFQKCKNKKESDMLQDEIIINDRIIEKLKKELLKRKKVKIDN